MKLAIERAALLKSLGHVQSVVERRTTIPILSNVRLEAAKGTLGLTATDLDLSVVESTKAEVTQPGATTAPAHTLYDVVRKLPEGTRVTIERSASGGEITLRSGRATFDLPCLPADEFPTMGDEGLGNGIADGDARVQAGVRVLEDDLQLAAIAIHVALPQTGELHVVVIHLPAAGFEQTQDEPPSGRLATAALPHQPERLPRHDLEVHAVNGFNFPH